MITAFARISPWLIHQLIKSLDFSFPLTKDYFLPSKCAFSVFKQPNFLSWERKSTATSTFAATTEIFTLSAFLLPQPALLLPFSDFLWAGLQLCRQWHALFIALHVLPAVREVGGGHLLGSAGFLKAIKIEWRQHRWAGKNQSIC